MSLTNLLRRSTTETADSSPRSEADTAGLDAQTVEAAGCGLIGDVRWRDAVRVAGRVRSVRVQPRANVPTLECTLVDPSGGITVVFLGRRYVPGIRLGSRMIVEGRAASHHGKLALLNPLYTLLPSSGGPVEEE